MRRILRQRAEAGAVSGEYVAAVIVVGLIVAALLAAGLPGSVRDWGEYAVCQLFATEDACTRPSTDPEVATGPEDTPQPPVCTTNSTSRDQRRTTDWIFSRNIDGERYQITELSDGTVVIHDTEYSGEGHSAGIGIEIPLGARDKLGLSASGHFSGIEESGRMFVLTPAAFEEYRDTMADIAVDAYINGPQYLDMALGLSADDIDEYMDDQHALHLRDQVIEQLIEQHVTHDYMRTRDEVSLSLGGGYKGISAATTLAAGAEKVIAVDRETGVSSITMQLDAEQASQLGVGIFGVGAGVDGSGRTDAAITIEIDADGEPLTASLATGVEVSGGGFVGLDPGSIPGDAVDGLQTAAGFGVNADEGGRVQTTYSLDLQDDDLAQEQLAAFLDNPVTGLDDFIDLAGRRGEVLMEAYDVESESQNIDLAIRVLAQAGLSDSDDRQVMTLAEAISYDPFNGLLHREDCLQ